MSGAFTISDKPLLCEPKTVQSIGEMGFFVASNYVTTEVSYYEGVSLKKSDPIDYDNFMEDFQANPSYMKFMYIMLLNYFSIRIDTNDDTFTAVTKYNNGTVNVLTPEPDHIHKVCVNAKNCPGCTHGDVT